MKNNSQISLLALLAILNSRLIEFYYQSTTVPKAGGFYIYKVMFLNDIPIAIPDEALASQLEKLQLKMVNMNEPNTSIEHEIDQIVYELYGLTEEEIRIVEGKANIGSVAEPILANVPATAYN
jgi:adenine-specific DNA-methyltransferase